MNDIDKPIHRVLDAYTAAVFNKDVEAFMRLYDPAVRVFDTWGVWSYEGAPAWQVAVDGWLTSLGSEKVKVSFDAVKTAGGPELATLSAVVTYAGLSAQGEALRAMQNRISWVLRTSGHVLRIVHEHTSVPIAFTDMKAMLQRDPAATKA